MEAPRRVAPRYKRTSTTAIQRRSLARSAVIGARANTTFDPVTRLPMMLSTSDSPARRPVDRDRRSVSVQGDSTPASTAYDSSPSVSVPRGPVVVIAEQSIAQHEPHENASQLVLT